MCIRWEEMQFFHIIIIYYLCNVIIIIMACRNSRNLQLVDVAWRTHLCTSIKLYANLNITIIIIIIIIIIIKER